jgi:amino acid transporter
VHERLRKLVALAVFSSDAISSTAYGTEQIMLVLVAAGAAATSLALPIALGIGGLLAILILSYRQTITAYPSAGGAYIVTCVPQLWWWPGTRIGGLTCEDATAGWCCTCY